MTLTAAQAIGARPIERTDVNYHVTAAATSPRPICVDLDGTLIRTDVLQEGVLAILANPSAWRSLPSLATTSRADLKMKVARATDIDVETLPYNQDVIAYLREMGAAGHRIVLATAATARIAHAVADHLKIFDEVICSDETHNLKGPNKAAALVERFGEKQFDYLGNDSNDLAVWAVANRIVTVDTSAAVKRKAAQLGTIEKSFDTRPGLLRSMLRAMRPHQWSKNVLVCVPMLAAHAVADPWAWLSAFAILASFCATASSIYLVNDLLDIASDRRHARKRNRPIASGAISIPDAIGLSVVLLATGLVLASVTGALLVVVTYAALSTSYSLVLKRFPLVDVFVLAALYTLRILGGGVATGHPPSLWLLAFSGFIFLSLALVKRTEELLAIERSGGGYKNARRGYQAEDRPLLQMFGCASAFAASVVLALFVGSSAAFQTYQAPEILWLIVPIILFWLCRLWLATGRGYMHDDPIVYAARDWVSWIAASSIGVVAIVAATGIVSFN